MSAYRPLRDRAMRAIASMDPNAPAIIPLIGELTQQSGSEIRRQIDRAKDRPEIRLVIMSNGGCDDVGQDIARDLRQVGTPVGAHVAGRCDSAAIWPLLAARRRSAGIGSTFTLHRGTASLPPFANASELRALARNLEALDRDYFALIARLALPEVLQKRMRFADVTLTAREAAAYRLIDHVGRP